MAINKVIYNTENGAETLIDLTCDSVTPETLAEGATAHNSAGEIITGKIPITPDYIVAEAERVASNVQATRTAKSLVFPVMSDFHLWSGNSDHNNSLISAQYAGMGIAELKKRIHLDFTGYLGDYSWMNTSYIAEQVMKDITAVKKTTNTDDTEIWCVGNHDLNYGKNRDRLLTLDEMYSYIGANSDGVKPFENTERGYGYIDFADQKIRVIYLNTCDASDLVVPAIGTENASSEWISPTQIQWLADTALDFSNKDKPSEWGIVLVGHHPLHYSLGCFGSMMTILEAYKDGLSGELSCTLRIDTDASGNKTYPQQKVSYNFSAEDRAEIICNIHGHNHNCGSSKISSTTWKNSTEVTPWLWRFCIPNISAGRYNESATSTNEAFKTNFGEFDDNGNPVYWTKETGTAKATSFCVVNIDRKDKKIYAYIFGAGKDRVFSYAEEYVPAEYNIGVSVSNCSASANNPTVITEDGTATLTFTANSGYELPDTVSVTGASYSWDKSTGTLTLSVPTTDVAVSVVAIKNIVNLIDMSKRDYVLYSQANGDPQFINANEAHNMDYTKIYATDSTGRRGYYPVTKVTYTKDEARNGFSYKVSSTSGYGLEFPIAVTGGKKYILTFNETQLTTGVLLFEYNADTTFNRSTNLKDGGGAASNIISRTIEFTPNEGYLYSLVFKDSIASNTHIITDISLTEM